MKKEITFEELQKMNRHDRRKFTAVNNFLKIPGTNKSIINKERQQRKLDKGQYE
jgi:hypothetical protein